jgi:DNA-binding transcriptional MocR family regulator
MDKTYEKIAGDLETAIREGKFRLRERLPSVRALCERYRCSKSTAVKAYDVLKSKHFVYSIPQSGCYIVERRLETELPRTGVIDFSRGNPLLGDLYIPDFQHCLARAANIGNANVFSDDKLYGIPSLRNLLPKYLANFQVFTNPDNIFVNLGVQQALDILNKMSFPNGKDMILLEQPTFRYFVNYLQMNGAKVLGIRRDQTGIDLDFLEKLFKTERIKFFYAVPNSHNPLGTCYSREQRHRIAQLAQKYDVYIVEDDYFGDVADGDYGDPLFSLGDYRHHIYLKSFIKIIPWIRIGLVVMPTHLLPVFTDLVRRSYFNSYFSPSLVSQSTLEIYIRSNLLRKHAALVSKEVAHRRCRLSAKLADVSQYGAEFVGGESGFYSYLKLPHRLNEQRWIANLRQRKVIVTPGSDCFLDGQYSMKGVRLSVARTDAVDIDRGVAEIIAALR